MVGFLGANGAGKTTSLKIALDFIRPTSGRVVYGPQLGGSAANAFKNIGFLPERPYYYPHLKGREFIQFMGELSGMRRKTINEKITPQAKRFRLDHALDRELKTYSKGMLQRIGFLVTVLHEPKLIILDEPLSGLDPVGRKEMKDIMVEIHKEGRTVFFSSHIVSDVEEVCDRVIFLRHGKLIYDGPVLPLLQDNAKQVWKFTLPSGAVFEGINYLSKTALGSGLESYVVETHLKDQFVQEIVKRNISLIGLEQQKPHLEEIFYQTRNN